ncbi:MAG TPA: Nif3-like dinuclear metal center hexameric protein [Gemmatimonadota bacterium]|nr:Nif3-like dinuclear metal center hexameric protein [Gemmatimonadota bacterium]
MERLTPALSRDDLVAYLDEYLMIEAWEDRSLNGLQVEGDPEIDTVALATDAALATFEMAAEAGAQLLIVHHGLFWGAPIPITGAFRSRLAALLHSQISLYAAHLPLDAHPEVGNNAVMARLLGIAERRPFGRLGTATPSAGAPAGRGRTIGFEGRLPEPVGLATLAGRLEALLGVRPDVLGFGDREVERVAIVSGDASDLIPEAAAAGVGAFITGESSHVAWHAAREHRLNVIFAGHYATETLGVRALGDHVAARFGVETIFLDAPTGY